MKFYPVSHEELTEARRDFPLGRYPIRIEEQTFRLSEYRAFLAEHADSIDSFQAMELLTDVEDAFDIEVPDYELNGVTTFAALVTVIERRL